MTGSPPRCDWDRLQALGGIGGPGGREHFEAALDREDGIGPPPNGARLIPEFDGYAIDAIGRVWSRHKRGYGGADSSWHEVAAGGQVVYLRDKSGVRTTRTPVKLMREIWPEVLWPRPAAAPLASSEDRRLVPGLDSRYAIDADGVVWSACRGGQWRALAPSPSGTVAIHDGAGQRVQRSWRSLHALAWPELQTGVRTGHGMRAELVADAVSQRLEALHLTPPTAQAVDTKAIARELAAELAPLLPQPVAPQPAARDWTGAQAREVARLVSEALQGREAGAGAAATTGHWARLADIACTDLSEERLAGILGVGVGAVRSWRSGRSVPGGELQRRLERVAVALWALRLGLDDGALADAREALRTLARGRWAAAAWAEVAGAEVVDDD